MNRRLLLLGNRAKGISWYLRDEFTMARSPGAVHNTAPEPGPGGNRNLTDASSVISIANGKIQTTGAANAYLDYPGAVITRTPGVLLFTNWTPTAAHTWARFGFSTGNAGVYGSEGAGFELGDANDSCYLDVSNSVFLFSLVNGISYPICSALRSTGAFLFNQVGGLWLLAGVSNVGSTATLYPAIHFRADGTYNFDFMRGPTNRWLPPPLGSDGFGGTWGITDGLTAPQVADGGMGAGGSGKTWTTQLGTWANTGGVAAAATLDGTANCAIATCDLGTADVWATVDVTLATLKGGLVLRYIDNNNYLYASIVANTATLIQVLAGTPTTIITAAATYSAGKRLFVSLNGTNAILHYNETLKGLVSSTVNAAFSGATKHGLISFDTGNTFDNWAVYPKGTGGEYSGFNRYIQ